MEQKILFVKRVEEPGKGAVAGICREFEISRKTGYKWLGRYRQEGQINALADRSRRPRHSPKRTSKDLEERILELRKPDGWGARKIAYLLWEEGWKIAVITVHRVLLRHGQVHPLDRHDKAESRFERAEPNDLFQMDFKGAMGRRGAQDEPLSLLDDHSRYGVGLFAMRDHCWQRVRDCLIQVFEDKGKPRQMLMDHGTPWWNNHNGWGLSRLSVFLMEQDIDLIYGRVAHPQTQGKVERFHGTLNRSMIKGGLPERWEQWQSRYDGFLERYNYVRPHESLGMQRPAQRYRPSARMYQPKVEAWRYGEGVKLVLLDAGGLIRWEGRRYFACEALAHRQVAAEQIGRRLLVRFRNMYIREIDLETNHTLPFIHPVTTLS